MTSPDTTGQFWPQSDERPSTRVALIKDWGDRLCCGALIATGLVALAGICWFVWQMPPLR